MTTGVGGRPFTRPGWSTRPLARRAQAGSARRGMRRNGRRGTSSLSKTASGSQYDRRMLSRDELVRVVTADLAYLLEEWDEQIDDDSLRRNSSVLRRLLVDNELQRAWKAAGFVKEPHIVTSTLTHTVGRLSHDLIAFASAGGAKFNGMEMRGVFIGKKAMTPDELLQLRGGAMPAEELLGLRAFVERPCMV